MVEGIISFEDWSKVDLRVGEIIEVEEIEGADKLWKLSVDLGKEIGKRTICAGMKPYYSEDELMNKKIIVVVNLAPRKMRGIESQGMLLAAVAPKGVPSVERDVNTEGKDESTPQAYPEKFSKKIFTKGKVVLISPDTLKGTSKEIGNGAKVR